MANAIEVQGLAKTYAGGVIALSAVDLKVRAGSLFGLLGPNGAGKTTLMRILTTQFKPTAGEARIFGLDVVKQSAAVRKIIGYVPQETSVWGDLSGFENMLIYAKIYGLPARSRRDAIYDMLDDVGLRAAADDLVKTYSGGMVRRLEIACAMLITPRVLFLDEPTLGLDPSARIAVWEKLTSFKAEYGTTVFFSTHYMDEANAYADEVAIMNSGKIVTSGTTDELKHSLRGETLRFGLVDTNVDEYVLSRIRDLERVNSAALMDSTLSVTVEDAETALPGVMKVLSSLGVDIARVATAKPTLDDVFLKYAGATRSTDRETGQANNTERGLT
ncbi:MAG: ABC transporter ATP-binding protein [Halobacteriota archaeon]